MNEQELQEEVEKYAGWAFCTLRIIEFLRDWPGRLVQAH